MATYKNHLSEPFSSKEQYKRKGKAKIEKSPSLSTGNNRPHTPPATPPGSPPTSPLHNSVVQDENNDTNYKNKEGGEQGGKLHNHKEDGHHAKEAEVMVPMKGQYLPSLRLDGPYGTASRYVL